LSTASTLKSVAATWPGVAVRKAKIMTAAARQQVGLRIGKILSIDLFRFPLIFDLHLVSSSFPHSGEGFLHRD
jgi:hypothetical protein